MEDLLIYGSILALAYYFFIHKPKDQESQPFTHNQSTQTEPIINQDEQELASTLDTLIRNIRQLNREIK